MYLTHHRRGRTVHKGQAATEYLLLLSVLLILIVIVISMITDLPGTLNLMVARGNNEFWTDSEIGIIGHTYYSNGEVDLLIKNNKPYPITLTSIEINGEDYEINTNLNPGESQIITLYLEGCNPGDPYSLTIGFRFYDDDDRSRGVLTFSPNIPITGRCES